MDAAALPPKLMGVHHSAFRCRDAEQTRVFYEEVLGLPLKAALVIEPGSGPASRGAAFLHLFFELKDGNYVAFFDKPDDGTDDKFEMRSPFDLHFAMQAENLEELMRFKAHLDAHDIPCFGPIDHHFVKSIYFADPNGLNLEITAREPEHDAIMADEAATARDVLATWAQRKAAMQREKAA